MRRCEPHRVLSPAESDLHMSRFLVFSTKECVATALILFAALGFDASSVCGQTTGQLFSQADLPWLRSTNEGHRGAEEEHLETDRDSFTPSTSTVKSGRLLFESAYSFIDNGSSSASHSFPEILNRYGLADGIELRFGWNYEVGGGGSVAGGHSGRHSEGSSEEKESQVLYGLKLMLTEQDHWLPESAMIVQGTTPTSGPETASDMQLGYVFGWKFFDGWQFDSSLRCISTVEEEDHFNEWAPSVVLKVPVTEQWNIHSEYFGLFSDGRFDEKNGQYFSPGLHYLISPDLEIGVRTGWGLSNDAADFFTNAGLGLRF